MITIKQIINNYIKGEYHCDTCPYCWGGNYCPGIDDYDVCGCYIRGEIQDTCRLLPPIRFLFGWGKKKRAIYGYNHEYDDFGEWYSERCEREKQIESALKDYLKTMSYGIVYVGKDGRAVLVNGEYKSLDLYSEFYRFADACVDIIAPKKCESLKDRWKKLILDTWHRFIDSFKPYFLD